MLLLCVTVSCVLFGLSAGFKNEEVCYGRNFRIPSSYTPPIFYGQLYHTPNGRPEKLMMDNGEAKDPRLKVSSTSVELTDVTESDDGYFSISDGSDTLQDVIRLIILECAETETKYYGDMFSFDIPREAESLECNFLTFTGQPKVLWNRSDRDNSKGDRGQVKGNVWEIRSVSQQHMGSYNFRRKDKTVLSRIKLIVQERFRRYVAYVNEQLLIKNPPVDTMWTVTFKREGAIHSKTLMQAGHLVEEDDWDFNWNFAERIQVLRDGIKIDPVESTDTGLYEFRDLEGHLAQLVDVVVYNEQPPTFIYVGITFGIIFAVIVICCCVRKFCREQSSSIKDASAPQTVAAPAPAPVPAPAPAPARGPAVYYHDLNQPGAPTYTLPPGSDYFNQPLNSLISREPTSTSPEPPVYNPVDIHVSSPQPEVAPLGGQEADPAPLLGADCLSSDPEPKFELKGLPSAPPLSLDSSCVYNSEKLNFL
ncbi:uncharacterized protein LOC117260613 isoform X1 [Epinephelus lanceolatus]|uniref:uncharacterized protein LOC117260613 n=1 Tax=Epinephelus lanceolatus TaxID=310571 RepID=UPI0014486066|nr:uncharacterized protein LOC117260613 [Epinephelus lanceolatus]